MTTSKDFLATWLSLSIKVLSSILVDDGAVFAAHEILGGHAHWFPSESKPVYEAVLKCMAENTPPTLEAVTLRVNGNTPPKYVSTIAQQFNDEDNRRLVYNAENLRKLGILAQLRGFGRELSKLDDIDDISQATDKMTTKLGGILIEAVNRPNDSKSISDLAWVDVERAQKPGIPTGLDWFDNLTGGLWAGMNYQIAAAYKQGKTTLMRNVVLYSASLNNPVGVFCAEGTREAFTLDCQAMLAARILISQGNDSHSVKISGLDIRRYYWQSGVFKKQELEAIHEAREIWNGLPIYIWDTTDGIRNLTTLGYLVKRGRVHYGCTSFWADYSQLFGESGTIYERQSATALTVQSLAQTENVAFCMLNQKNEEGVKGGDNNYYSPHIKGGGDAAAAADFLLIPKLDNDNPTILDIILKHSRHTRTGNGTHFINVASGLIVKG